MPNLIKFLILSFISLIFYSCSAKEISNNFNPIDHKINSIQQISGKISIKGNNKISSGYFKLFKTNNSLKLSVNNNFLAPDKSILISDTSPLNITQVLSILDGRYANTPELILSPNEIVLILLGGKLGKTNLNSLVRIEHFYKSASKKNYPSLTKLTFQNLEIKLAISYINLSS